MKRAAALVIALLTALCLAACGRGTGSSDNLQSGSNILIAYDPAQRSVEQAAAVLADALSGDLLQVQDDSGLQADAYEYIVLGFAPEENALPQAVEDFLRRADFGARTVYLFVSGGALSSADLYSAVSQLQPGALMGRDVLILSPDTTASEVRSWADSLGISGGQVIADTAATAAVTPGEQQVLYLWEPGNAPARTEYTVNNGGYSDDPDFRPYITSFPVPEGTAVKGAVLICPGGAFQFRSDRSEGTDVAEVAPSAIRALWWITVCGLIPSRRGARPGAGREVRPRPRTRIRHRPAGYRRYGIFCRRNTLRGNAAQL